MMAQRALALALVLGIAGTGAGCGSSEHSSRRTAVTPQVQRQMALLHQQVTRSLHQHSRQSYGSLPDELSSRTRPSLPPRSGCASPRSEGSSRSAPV